MDQRIIQFLSNHRISVLSVTLPDGSLHSAACHYSHKDNPLEIIIYTESTTRKCLSLVEGNIAQASLVVGFSEEEWISLQMSGTAKMLKSGIEVDNLKPFYEEKFKSKINFDPQDVFIVFTPKWWRYSEYKNKVFLSSNT